MDKAFWTAIKEAKFAVPAGSTPADLLPGLLAGLGATDPELRDDLCYEVLGTWVSKGVYTPAELRPLAEQLMADLRAGLGEGENDQVFRRTFSVLILGEIVAYDAKTPFLTADELQQIMTAGLQYLADEQDLRGYVPEKGWAHSAAHTADFLLGLARHPGLGAPDLERLLYAITAKLLAPTQYAFVDHEEYRLCRAVLAVLRRETLPLERVVAWLQAAGGSAGGAKAFVLGKDNVRFHNLQAFLAALHLLLEYQEVPDAVRTELLPAVHAALKSHMPWWF